MRAKLTLLRALVLGTVGGVLATGCQTYDFEPVEPLAISQTTETRDIRARNAKPNLMMLVDTSGSMTLPVNENLRDSSGVYVCRKGGTSSGEICGVSEAFPCDTGGALPGRCPTRWTSLQKAMDTFLTTSGSIARIGLATYPDLSADKVYKCGGTAGVTVALPTTESDDDATLKDKAAEVNGKLLAIKNSSSTAGVQKPEGGTPTNDSLQYMLTLPELKTDARSNFVLLLTDGLPNCNSKFPTPYPNASCSCTLGTLSGTSLCSYDPYDKLGCLDKDGSVSAVKALKDANIKTIVIGFGAELASGTGPDVLNAMAQEGGFSRTCTVNSDCGTGDTCDMSRGLCNRRFYQAGNADELAAALRKISETIQLDDPCLLTFAAGQEPSSQELVVVYVNGDRLSPGADTWTLNGDKSISFTGSTCERIKASTSANPVKIEVRAVQKR
ncbi:MAG TPA: adventurous gliding motility lipoprotein CglB [Archangium sp.]|uniref:adventurous gliding motility lipoprotein CglB n=1 Tax=Archangium sp. TaxID=1872627 RepID=UPI002E309C82|nr:adventurous gliding motility lipoprotein CglB [Archangium sp.]HEX5753640.1 adventurous gliding motility lipoprotein CglB [Archangium sp.]